MPPGKKAAHKQVVLNSLESCMDAGVDQEERGERFAVGTKAERHYQQALDLYRQAAGYDPSSVDALYNAYV